jgi:hypothetical protein
MSYLLNESDIKGVIEKNNSLIRKKGALKTLLNHNEVRYLLTDVINQGKQNSSNLGENGEKYFELLQILQDQNWNLDKSIDEIVNKGVAN